MREQHCKVVRMGSESSFQVGRHEMFHKTMAVHFKFVQ